MSQPADSSPGVPADHADNPTVPPYPRESNIIEAISQEELPGMSAAEDFMSSSFFSNAEGTAIRSHEEAIRFLSEPIRRREAFVEMVAQRRGVSQPTTNKYTVEDWRAWLGGRALDDVEMREAVERWQKDFASVGASSDSCDVGVDRFITERFRLALENTRQSRARSRHLLHGAWKKHLKDTCGGLQMAMLFLRYPATAAVDTLLRGHEVQRARP